MSVDLNNEGDLHLSDNWVLQRMTVELSHDFDLMIGRVLLTLSSWKNSPTYSAPVIVKVSAFNRRILRYHFGHLDTLTNK